MVYLFLSIKDINFLNIGFILIFLILFEVIILYDNKGLEELLILIVCFNLIVVCFLYWIVLWIFNSVEIVLKSFFIFEVRGELIFF